MRVTLKRIAEECSVSITATSEILGSKAHIYKEETRELVRTTAARLGYRPNVSARATQSGRFNSIALLQDVNHFRSDFQMDLIEGIQNALSACGQQMPLMEVPDEDLLQLGIRPKLLEVDLIDSLIINYHAEIPKELELIVERGKLPAIWVNSKRAVDCVHPDDFDGMARLTRRLVEDGHRRIACFDPGNAGNALVSLHYSRDDRRRAYVDVMQDLKSEPSFPGDGRDADFESMRALLAEHLSGPDRPTAIILAGTSLIPVATLAAADAGVRIPGELAIASVANSLGDAWSLPPAYYMLIPWYRVGCESVRVAMSRLDGASPLAPVAVECPVVGPGEAPDAIDKEVAYQRSCRERRLDWIERRTRAVG